MNAGAKSEPIKGTICKEGILEGLVEVVNSIRYNELSTGPTWTWSPLGDILSPSFEPGTDGLEDFIGGMSAHR